MGRKAHRPDPVTRRQVETMAAYGIPEADIATVIEIDPKTLRRHYRKELSTGHIKANTKVAENLYRKATGDGRESVVAAIFWLKTRARWKETTIHEVTEATGNDADHSDAPWRCWSREPRGWKGNTFCREALCHSDAG
jgi:hypothetical protein